MENNKGGRTEAEVKDDHFHNEEVLDPEEDTTLRTGGVRREEGRKVKRFRFLISEFTKEAHPDAARRERLSREIPGFSPRRVDVWFQNRRAKKKRLIQMRAILNDFNNVQTLHYPYRAAHGISTPVSFPVDFVPTLVDVTMEKENGDHMPLRSLSPAFSYVGFAPGGSMGTPDVLSQSLNPTGQYYPDYSLGPVSAGPRSSNLFDQQNSEALPYQGQYVQLLQLRGTVSSGSKPFQPTLSLSWEGGTNMDVGDCLASECHRDVVKEDFHLGPVGEDGRATFWDRRGDGKESLLESRELEERTAAEVKSVRMKFEEVDKWELEFEDVA
ncbi:hypothetical protein DL98DRAFT_536463 [Cadophora sp. DSE1049]|nr:hypothetical protein DL98DRAFT_536463 [Cadophora sp. DSE1049]